MSGVSVLIELVPIGLALVSVVSCTKSVFTERRRKIRIVAGLGVVCSVLLIVAQSSWWTTYAINGGLQGTEWANMIWTFFNMLTMTTFIVLTSTGDLR